MLVKPAVLSNDRPVNQNSTASVTDATHPMAANATSEGTVAPPFGQFEVLRGGAAGLAGTAEWAGGGAAAASPPPVNGTAADISDVVGAIMGLLFQLPPGLKEKVEATQHEIAMEVARNM